MRSWCAATTVTAAISAILMSAASHALDPNSRLPPAIAPLEPRPRPDAPNVLLVLIDDVGFAQSSTFGGPVPTPNYEALASRGLRYNRFHTTAMCSSTRAALLTGRNHHRVGM